VAEKANHPYSLAYINCSLGFLLVLKGDLTKRSKFSNAARSFARTRIFVSFFPRLPHTWGLPMLYRVALTKPYHCYNRRSPKHSPLDEFPVSRSALTGKGKRILWQVALTKPPCLLDEDLSFLKSIENVAMERGASSSWARWHRVKCHLT